MSYIGKVNPLFLKLMKFDRRHLRLMSCLPSALKALLYRIAGASIGKGVRIGAGTYFINEFVSIGDFSEFGENCLFMGRRISLGKYAAFENNARWKCRNIVVGDMFYSSDGSIVGWGGEFAEEAELIIGDGSFIGEEAMLNPSRTIMIGNNTAIGARVKIYTHQFWQSVLDGYEARFLPVSIEDDCMIGCGAVILPGVSIGKGTTVIANSVVTRDFPAKSLAGGIPAVEMPAGKIYPKKLNDKDKINILGKLFSSFKEKLPGGKAEYYQFITEFNNFQHPHPARAGRAVILTYSVQGADSASLNKNTTVFDCGKNRVYGKEDQVSDELREFLRKRGIRFEPSLWRYKRKR